eukprot:2569510-Prymnesium_polylepis.1
MGAALRLRRLLVVDHRHQLIGIIGRKDLAPHVLHQRSLPRAPARDHGRACEVAEPAAAWPSNDDVAASADVAAGGCVSSSPLMEQNGGGAAGTGIRDAAGASGSRWRTQREMARAVPDVAFCSAQDL